MFLYYTHIEMCVAICKSDNLRWKSRCGNNFIAVYCCEHITDDHEWIAMPVKLLSMALEKQAPGDWN